MKKILHKLGFHFWVFKFTTGWNKYYECSICGKRKVEYPNGGYQPIDRTWLKIK